MQFNIEQIRIDDVKTDEQKVSLLIERVNDLIRQLNLALKGGLDEININSFIFSAIVSTNDLPIKIPNALKNSKKPRAVTIGRIALAGSEFVSNGDPVMPEWEYINGIIYVKALPGVQTGKVYDIDFKVE